jgi:actin-related protein
MVDPSQTKAIIIDNGSGMMKAGIGGEDKPRAVFPCVVGRPKEKSVIPGSETKQLYLGEEAQKLRGVLQIEYPIEHGIVKSWENMKKIWEHTIVNELRVDAKECALMATEAPLNPKANREEMISISFETFDVKAFYVGIQAVLAMFSAGRTTGIVVDSGDGVTHTVPIYQTYSVPHAVKKIMLAGRDISKHLETLLTERGFVTESTAQAQIVREIKEQLCYVTMDYKSDMESAQGTMKPKDDARIKGWKEKFEKTYTLPDGNLLQVGSERFRAPELIFQPKLAGKDVRGVHQLTLQSIEECDLDVRKELWENVILSGGSTMFENYPERLKAELEMLAPKAIKINVVAQPERKYAVFLGAAQLAALSSFQNSWITKAEFAEEGPGIVHRKCF